MLRSYFRSGLAVIAVCGMTMVLTGCTSRYTNAAISRLQESEADTKMAGGRMKRKLPPIPIDPALLKQGKSSKIEYAAYSAFE